MSLRMRFLRSVLLFLLCIPALFAQVSLAQDNWSTFHHDVFRRGYSSSTLPMNMSLLWSYVQPGLTPQAICSSPAVVDSAVYFTARDRRLYCVDAYSGLLKWRSEPLGESWNVDYPYGMDWNWDSSPTVGDSLVFVGARNGSCYAFRVDGGQAWVRPLATKGVVVSSPLYVDGHLFVVSDGADGTRLWWLRADGDVVSYTTDTLSESFAETSPAMVPGGGGGLGFDVLFGQGYNLRLVTPHEEGYLVLEQQRLNTECYLRSSPAVRGNNRIYLGSGYRAAPNGLLCVNPYGSPNMNIWWGSHRPEWEWTAGTAAFHGDSVWAPGGSGPPDIYCVKDMGSSRVFVWERDFGVNTKRNHGHPVSPAVAGGLVFMAVSRIDVGTGPYATD